MSDNKTNTTYLRRRAYNKVHVRSWLIYLEKDGFVRCSFKNCDFMAFDVEEMCDHYGFCQGESSFAKYVCHVCSGRTNSESKLQFHMSKAHNIAVPEPKKEPLDPEVGGEGSNKPSRVLISSWGYSFETNNYVKCITCSYLANTLQDMQRHYSVCKQETDQLLYVCPECKGRTGSVNPLLWHMECSHKIFKSPNQFNHITQSMLRYWQREIDQQGQACCLHIREGKRDCFFFDVDLLGVIEHAQSCKGPKGLEMKLQCSKCQKWTNTLEKLSHHMKVSHSVVIKADVATHSNNKNDNEKNRLSQTHVGKCLATVDVKCFNQVLISEVNEFSIPPSALKWHSDTVNDGHASSTNTNKNLNLNKKSSPNEVKRLPMLYTENCKGTITGQGGSEAESISVEFSQDEEEDEIMVIDLGLDSSEGQASDVKLEDKDVSSKCVELQQRETPFSRTSISYEMSSNSSDDVFVEVHSDENQQESHPSPSGEKDIVICLEDEQEEEEDGIVLVTKEIEQKEDEEVSIVSSEEICSISRNSDKEKPQKDISAAFKLNLFRDSASSDEDDVFVIQENGRIEGHKDQDYKPLANCQKTEEDLKRKSLRHYSKRPRHNSNSSSEVKRMNTSATQVLYTKSKYYHEDPDSNVTLNFLINEDGKIHWDNENKNSSPNELIRPTQSAYTKPIPKVCIKERNENSEEISKSSEKNDKLMRLDDARELSRDQSRSTCGGGLRESIKFENSSFEVVDVQYNLVKTKDGSAVVENKCDMILHTNKNPLSDASPVESHFVVAVETAVSPNFQIENLQTEKDLEIFEQPDEIIEGSDPNVCQISDVSANAKNTSNTPNSKDLTHLLKFVVNCVDNVDTLHSSIENTLATEEIAVTTGTSECLKPDVNEEIISNCSYVTDNINFKKTNTDSKQLSEIENNRCDIKQTKVITPNNCPKLENSTSSNNVQSAVTPNLDNHSKSLNESMGFPGHNNLVICEENVKHVIDDHINLKVNSGLDVGINSSLQKDTSDLVKDLAKVSFLYQGRLVRRSSESSVSQLEESTDECKEHNDDIIKKTYCNSDMIKSLKQHETIKTRDSNICEINSNNNNNDKMDHDHLESNKIEMSTIPKNNCLSDEESGKGTSDNVSRRSSSDVFDDSTEDGEDFLGTDEEVDMKNNMFTGFKEMSETLRSRRKSFHQLLNRLSESENEEWYISAGNLSMDFQKAERISSNNILLKQNHYVHHKGDLDRIETTKMPTKHNCSHKSEQEEIDDVSNYCASNQACKKLARQNHSHLNSKSVTVNLPKSHSSVTKNVLPLVINSNKKNLINEKSSKNPFIIKSHIDLDCNGKMYKGHSSMPDNKNQLDSENDEPISLIGEKFSPDPKEFETVNSQLNDEKSPRKYTFVNLKKNYDHKKDETKKDKIISSSTISDVIISSDKDDSNIELKFLPAVSKIKLHSNEKKGVKCLLDNNIDDTLSNLTSDHNQNQDILNKLVNVNDSLSVESDDIDEKQKDIVKRSTMLTSQETKLNSCQLSLTQHNLDKGNKIVAKVQEKSISFIKENQNSLKNEICDKIVINKQRERANVVTSTPTGRGENPLLTVDEEECSAFETSECELICKNVSSDERKSPYFGHTENEPNKCFKENSSVDHKNVGENRINEEAVSVLPKKRGRKPKQKTDKEANSFAENIDDAICKSVINDENSKSFKKRGRKPKPKNNEEEKSLAETNDNSFFETGVNEAELSALPKKRGRKPKPRHNEEEKSVPETNNGSVCENVINTEEIAAFPKKLGRKPKPKYSDEEHSVSEITNDSIFENMIDGGEISASPKKRGRKPKLKHRDEENSVSEINNDSICESIIDEGEISESPKKRGRKPKPKQREVENSVSEIKYDSVSEHLLNGEEISALPKKRGRKPKIKHVEANNLSKDNCKPILGNFSHEDNQNKINTSNPNISKNLKQNFTTSNKISDNLASTPKKRGRPPMNKSNNMINVSKHEGSFLLDYSKKSDVSVTQEDNEEILFSIYSEEADILLRSGSLQGIHLNQTKNSNQDNIITPASPLLNDSLLQNTIKRKRGRPPKIQYNQNHITFVTKESDLALPIKSNNSKTNDLKSEVDNTINHSFHKENILPKKRGRPFKQKLVACETVISEDDQIEAVPLSDRVLKSDFGQLEKRKRRPKLIFDNSDIGDEISSEIGVKNNNDMDVPTSNKRKRMSKGNVVDSGSELLDTDVIFINKDKLTDSIVDEDSDFDDRSSRIEEDDDDSDFCDLPKRKKRKRKVIFEHIGQESDEEDGNVKEKLKEKPTAIRKPLENQIFTAIHKSNDMVVCGVCKKEMRYKIYKKQHSIFTHYALCWIEGEEKPLDMKDDKEVVNRLWYSKKKLGKTPFRCFNCNLPKLSAVGFQSHIRFCGKEHEMENLLTTCPECGASMKPSSLRPHMYIKHSAKSKAANIDTSSIIPRTKRAAASKAAVAVIQHHKDEQEPEVLESESKGRPHCRPTSPQLKRMQFLYTKPNKIFPKEERERCDRSLRETNTVACSQLGCRFSANTTLAFRKHYFKCPFSSLKLEYKCRQCEYVHKDEAAVQQHLAQDHGELLEASTGSESGSDSYEGSDDEPGKPNAYRVALPFKFLKHSIVRCGRGSSFPKKYFFSEALLWTHKMRCSNLTSDVLFPEAVEVARPLAEDQASRYIPTTTSSIRFRGNDGCWRTLDRFQGTLVDGIPVMFTGGPVWACAWASVPDSEHSQYLAVAPHPNMDQTHEMAAIYSYPSVIQVWALGQLTNSLPQPEPEGVPQFLMGIAHNRGAVWSLQWCPSGCHQDTRVGLLAAACSDGNVAIYSVPRLQPTSTHTIYEMEPVMELKLGCEMMSQCKCIEWHGVAPHSTIVGGFANGMVALWDLHTSSSLLRNGKVIYPFKVIEAHLSAVTAVSVSPTPEASGAHLMTASLDRATKFWRLDDTTAPVNTLRKASVTDAVMPDTWMIAINAYDDVYSTNATHIMGYSYRETFNSTNTNFQPQIGTVWGVSFNEWINAIACASEMGKLTVLFRRQLLASEDSKKVKSNSLKQDLVSCSVQALSDSQETVKLGPKYQDCVDKIGLDISLDFNNGESKAHSNICSVDSMENYPILSINKVTWNKNYNSFTWMAAGLQCGLVLAPRITCLQSKDFSTLYKHNDNL